MNYFYKNIDLINPVSEGDLASLNQEELEDVEMLLLENIQELEEIALKRDYMKELITTLR